MTLLTRYILAELLKVFLLTLTGMTFLLLVVMIGVEASRQGLGIGPILRLIPYALPRTLPLAVPGTILFAACMVYSRISAANEVTVLKSLGLSPWLVLLPGLGLAAVVSMISFVLNDVGYSWGNKGLQRVVIQSAEEIAYGVLRTQRTYTTDRFSISVKSVEDKVLVQPTISFYSDGDMPQVTITAHQAKLSSNFDRNTLGIILTDGFVEVGDKVTMVFPDTIVREIPLSEASSKSQQHQSPAELSLRHIPEEMRQQRQRMLVHEQTRAAELAFALTTADYSLVSEVYAEEGREKVKGDQAHIARLNIELWRRTADAFSCLCFMCIGAPLAILRRQSDALTSFGYCFFPILVVYFPIHLFALDMAKQGVLPAPCLWLANGVCLVVSVWLMNKVLKH